MAITTTYNGIEYRSRLEARWAAFMQNIGWDIVYEPFDGDGYIPDFLVQGDRPFLVEVKPAVTREEYEAPILKAERGLSEHWKHDILIVGASHVSYRAGSCYHIGLVGEPVTVAGHEAIFGDGGTTALGFASLLFSDPSPTQKRMAKRKLDRMVQHGYATVQRNPGTEAVYHRTQLTRAWDWNTADWLKCRACNQFGMRSSNGGWRCRPCGHDHDSTEFASPYPLNKAWADACNDVKWRGTAA